jgi:hypothetical protein
MNVGRGSWGMKILGGLIVLITAATLYYSAITSPPASAGRAPLTSFDPEVVGRLEQRAWAQYYWRDWVGLFDSMLRMIRGQFGLSLPAAVYAAYENTRAQIAWARQGNEGGEAEERMRRFYELVREPSGGNYDSSRAAELEVRWWAVHRQRDQYPDRTALSQALADLYAEVYRLPVDRFVPAGAARAEAMDVSDQWIREGRLAESPLLPHIAELLVESYRSLSQAANTPGP